MWQRYVTDNSTWKCDRERQTEREIERERDAQIDYQCNCCAWALGKSVKVVAAKTNWGERNVKYEFNITSLLPNQKYKFKIILACYLTRIVLV